MVNNYNKLKKMYGLPDSKKLADVLEIDIKTDQETLLLQTIRNEVADKLYELMKILESILFTTEGSDAGLLYQENMIRGVSKDGFDLYKLFNELHYSGLKLRFKGDRKKDAEFINRIFKLWPELEKKLSLFFETIEKGWKEININSEHKPENYHG